MFALRLSLVPFALLVGLLVSCASTEPPYAHVIEPLALPDAPRIYLVSPLSGKRVQESLEASGLSVVRGLREANLLLRVRFGSNRKQTRDCGQVRNVKYELRRASRLVLWIRARGPTGRCADNMLDEISGELARLIGP